MPDLIAPSITRSDCRSCRRPIHWVPGVGWLHGELPQYANELPQYANEPISCERAHPVECKHHTAEPCPLEVS